MIPPSVAGETRCYAARGTGRQADRRGADKDWLRRRYLGEQASRPELAGEIGCSIRAVRNALAEARVPMRPQGQWKGRRAIDRATHRTHD